MLKDTYCPIAAAARVLQPKWNIQILRSICLYGVSNFNDIRRLIPDVSPTLVSARLKYLVENGILEKRCDEHSKNSCYVPTDAGIKLKHVLLTLGECGELIDQLRIVTLVLVFAANLRAVLRNVQLPDKSRESRTV